MAKGWLYVNDYIGTICCIGRHEVTEVRGIYTWIAVRGLGYSGADVAHYLGVTTSCVNRLVAVTKRPRID